MRFSTSAVSALAAASTLASVTALPANGLHHQHHKHQVERRDVVYVTNVVTVNAQGAAAVAAPAATPTSTPDAPAAAAPTPSPTFSLVLDNQLSNNNQDQDQNQKQAAYSPPATLVTSTTNSEAQPQESSTQIPTPESSAESTSSASSEPSGSSAPSDGSVGSIASQAFGITYSPYADSGSCKSASEIAQDVAQLSGFSVIRVYAPDCSVITALLDNLQSHQQIFGGLFYLNSLQDDINTLESQVKSSSRGWDAFYAISVGNEWVNSGQYDADTVVNAVNSGRSMLKQVGYSGPVVTVDTVPAYQNNQQLCGASDFAAVNQHAFWNGNTSPQDSGSFLQDTISQMNSLCGKDTLICETGWPTQGQTYQNAVPGTQEQLQAVQSIVDAVKDKVIMFTTFNDMWKQPGAYGVEQYWGLFN